MPVNQGALLDVSNKEEMFHKPLFLSKYLVFSVAETVGTEK